jgi:hypothetical protein
MERRGITNQGAVSFVVILTSLPQKSPNLFMTTQYNDYYTYAYLREDKTPYYIGKGRGNRAYDKRRTIKPPKDKSRILLLKKNLTEAEAFKHEVYMIFVLGRKDLGTGILRNLTNGGEGASGAVQSEEKKRKCSEANTGENHPLFGVSNTEAQKKAKSEKMSGEKHPNYGNTGALNPLSKAIISIEPDGTDSHFGSIREAARELVVDAGSLCYYLKSGHVLKKGKSKGWQFFYENSEGV